jgi:hypothetical protein
MIHSLLSQVPYLKQWRLFGCAREFLVSRSASAAVVTAWVTKCSIFRSAIQAIGEFTWDMQTLTPPCMREILECWTERGTEGTFRPRDIWTLRL